MRVGIIGIGAIAVVHINALKSCGEEIVALCDIQTEITVILEQNVQNVNRTICSGL